MTSWAAAFHGENDMMHGRKIDLRGCKKSTADGRKQKSDVLDGDPADLRVVSVGGSYAYPKDSLLGKCKK